MLLVPKTSPSRRGGTSEPLAYEYVTLESARDGVPAGSYIVCSKCRCLNGRQPNVNDWAAYDKPFGATIRELDPADRWGFHLATDPAALCKACYLKAFAKAYPEAASPTTLWDGRVMIGRKVARAP